MLRNAEHRNLRVEMFKVWIPVFQNYNCLYLIVDRGFTPNGRQRINREGYCMKVKSQRLWRRSNVTIKSIKCGAQCSWWRSILRPSVSKLIFWLTDILTLLIFRIPAFYKAFYLKFTSLGYANVHILCAIDIFEQYIWALLPHFFNWNETSCLLSQPRPSLCWLVQISWNCDLLKIVGFLNL